MKIRCFCLGLVLLTCVGLLAPALASGKESILLELRPRFEYVDSEGKQAAAALTTRTQLGLIRDGLFSVDGLKAHLEFTSVSALVERYDSTSAFFGPSQSSRAAIGDPTFTRATQSYLQYQMGDTVLKLGRQVLTHDDHRFIGNVGWRQMPQSFGALLVTRRLPSATLEGAYLFQRKGIKEELSTNYQEGSYLLFARWQKEELSLHGYAYLIQNLHDTFGLAIGRAGKGYRAKLEFAWQEDPSVRKGAVATSVNARFLRAEASTTMRELTLKANFTQFGEARGSATTGFATPLATLHGFDGWSDVLLGKAAGGEPKGLTDFFLTVEFERPSLGKLELIWHRFGSVQENLDFGKEVNLLYSRKLSPNQSLMLKSAFYEAGKDFGKDTRKLWVMYTYRLEK